MVLLFYLIFRVTVAFLMAVFVLAALCIFALVWVTVEVARFVAEAIREARTP
jgi:hypothetical protein